MRCMTEDRKGEKTLGIIVDFNWHRQLMFCRDMLRKSYIKDESYETHKK